MMLPFARFSLSAPQFLIQVLLVINLVAAYSLFPVKTWGQTGPIRVDQGFLEYISTLPDGRIVSLQMVHRDPNLMSEPGPPQPMFIRYSNDNGLSWSEAGTAFSYPAGKGVVSGGVSFTDKLGNLHCFSIRYYRLPKGELEGHSEFFHNYSADGGKTWTEPKEIDFGQQYVGAFRNVTELKSGRLLFGLNYHTRYLKERGEREGKLVTIYSDDHGETWHIGADGIGVPLGEFRGHPGALEPIVVELLDGRVWMIIRTQQGRFYQAFSADGGETWSETSPTDFEAPNAPGGILRLSDDRLVFCWNDLSQYPEGKVEHSGSRRYLHIAISGDDGKTWSPSRLIAQREQGELPNTNVAYPFLAETEDNHILVSYHRVGNKEGVSWWHPKVEVLRIDPDWIELTRDQENN